MDTVLTLVLPFLLVITIVIIVHELGHYTVGRLCGAAVESFAWGFGRSIFEVKDKRGTRWRMNWLPLGGFVKFVGESQMPKDVGKVEQGPIGKRYTELSPWQRLAVSLGGPFFNFVFAVAIFAAIAAVLGIQEMKVVVKSVIPGQPAAAAGFKPGDILLQAGDRAVKTQNDIKLVTQFSPGEPVIYRVLRDGRQMELTATPVESEDANPGPGAARKTAKIGFVMEVVDPKLRRLNPIEALGYGVDQVVDTIGTTIWVISKLRIDSFSGPLGVASVAGQVTTDSMSQPDVSLGDRLLNTAISLIFLVAVLSVGIGFFNLLPIPVLDGGAAVMCIAEGVTGKPIPARIQEVALTIGLFCILTFAVVVTWNDILKFRIG